MYRVEAPADRWITLFPAVGALPALRIHVHPIGIKAVRAARRALSAALTADPQDMEEAADALSRELLRYGIFAWEGVGDGDGAVLSVTPATIEHFLSNPDFFEAADREYVLPWARRDQEGNASPPLLAGTGAEATPASAIAAFPAMPSKRGAAKSARMKSTTPRRKKGLPSGTS